MQFVHFLQERNVLPAAISILFFLSMVIFIISTKKAAGIFFKQQYEKINNTLKNKKALFFDYENIQSRLSKNGAVYHLSFLKNPVVYLVTKFLLAFLGFFAGSFIHIGVGIIAAILLFNMIDIYLSECNKKDNNSMGEDLQTLYSSLQTQIKAGIYPADAMNEVAESISNKRLHYALCEFKGDVLTHISFKEALKRMELKFDNKYVTALILTLTQATETGCAIDLLNDLSDQIRAMREAELISKKGKLDRLISLCQLALLFVGVIFIVVVFFSEIGNMANQF